MVDRIPGVGDGFGSPWRPERMRRALAVAGVLAIAGLCSLRCHVSDKGPVIEITPEQIQERLEKKFPIKKKYLMVLELTLADPEVTLTEGSDRVGFGLSASTNVIVNAEDLEGKARMTSAIHYDRKEGALLLVDPRVEELTISPLDERYRDGVREVANLAAEEYLDAYELYRLDQSDFKQKIAKLIIKDVVVDDGLLKITLGPGE
jgi:hypothetical protein